MQIFLKKFEFKSGVCNRLLRFSVGIEDPTDIIQDLEQAFAKLKEGVIG